MCEQVAKKLGSVAFNVDDTIFEMSPMAYLHQGEGICQFAIAENPLDKFNNGNFLFGGLFLKHFYSIYDYDNELISLGVNMHSADIVSIHQKGEKATVKSLTQDANNHQSAFEMAAKSELIAGKQAPEGMAVIDPSKNERKSEFEEEKVEQKEKVKNEEKKEEEKKHHHHEDKKAPELTPEEKIKKIDEEIKKVELKQQDVKTEPKSDIKTELHIST